MVGNCLKRRQRCTHHLHVVGIEGLFIQGEFLRSEGVVQLNHLRELQEGINTRGQALVDDGTEALFCLKLQTRLRVKR